MSKIYAVRKGKIPGLYNTWDECKAQVDGFSGAEYKSFKDENEAKIYLGIASRANNGYEIYVDGSYNVDSGEYGAGLVIVKNGEVLSTVSELGIDKEAAKMRNVAGEILAATIAMQYCKEHNIENVKIYHDYIGIAAWCTGEWKAKNEFTRKYKEFYDNIKNFINIEFIKVDAHSNNEFNELADKEAARMIFPD